MIICKSPEEIEKMRRSGRLVREILGEIRQRVRPGVSTLELEKYTAKRLAEVGARPAFKGYRGYPCCLCTSVNDQIIHGIPSDRRLKEGDVLSVDLGVVLDGFYGDSAITIPVGEISEGAKKLLRVTEEALERAIEKVRPGNRLGDVSAAVQEHVENHGFSVVREFVGHGIGRELHEEPQIPNFGPPGRGPMLKEGMVLAIEPMVNAGSPASRVLDDQWTAVTVDGEYSAHFEHMVAVSGNGPDVLTRW
ncbi:MAG: type I methionyl aminopeptidase [Acidobacteria bacterium]|nr:type I methionyl aminopeptidase [Acidobacteriota bacterium]MBI1983955.1 type I methionyl aminopeptidase [Acidobacteriota bacterium]